MHIQRHEDECKKDGAIESKEWCKAAEGRGWVTILEIGGSVKGVSPIDRGKAALKEQRAHNIIDGTKGALGFIVLLGSVWARHAKDGTVGEKERAGRRVVELTAIVSLDGLHGGAKLRAHIGKKIRNSGKIVRFKAKWKYPSIMRTIINNDEIIFVTEHADNGRCPKIIVY